MNSLWKRKQLNINKAIQPETAVCREAEGVQADPQSDPNGAQRNTSDEQTQEHQSVGAEGI